MKRIIRGFLVVMVAAVLLGLGVAWARPGWLPAWARTRLGQLAAMAQGSRLGTEKIVR